MGEANKDEPVQAVRSLLRENVPRHELLAIRKEALARVCSCDQFVLLAAMPFGTEVSSEVAAEDAATWVKVLEATVEEFRKAYNISKQSDGG